MRKVILVVFIFLVSTYYLSAQDEEKTFYSSDFGAGIGLNYGGVGFNLTKAPIKYLSFGGHAGYNISRVTYGGEINLYLVPKNFYKVYGLALKAMYGYNTVYVVQGSNGSDKTFYGFNFGISNELRFGLSKKHGFNIDLILPMRSDEAIDYSDKFETNTSLTSITISIGYHREF